MGYESKVSDLFLETLSTVSASILIWAAINRRDALQDRNLCNHAILVKSK
jgi:hypothetical protein